MPSALINTISDVLPALMNGNGSPVGGILAEITRIFNVTWVAIIQAMPAVSKLPKTSLLFCAIFIIENIRIANIVRTMVAPKKPNSSQIIEKMKSLSANGKYKYFCLEENNPTPNKPPFPKLYSDWISWKPSPCGDAHGLINAINLWSLYGSMIIKTGTRHIAGIKIIARYFSLSPPKIIMQIIVMPRHIVMLIFGSNITRTQNTPPTNNTGSKVLKLLAFSLWLEKWQAQNSTKENLAISLGWKDSPNKFIHLFAP